MQVAEIKRAFAYNGLKLPDPNPGMSIDQVKAMFAMQFPELNNSVVEGPVWAGDHGRTGQPNPCLPVGRKR